MRVWAGLLPPIAGCRSSGRAVCVESFAGIAGVEKGDFARAAPSSTRVGKGSKNDPAARRFFIVVSYPALKESEFSRLGD